MEINSYKVKWIATVGLIWVSFSYSNGQSSICIKCSTPEEMMDFSTDEDDCCDNEIDEAMEARMAERRVNNNFFNTLRTIQSPSTLAGGGFTSLTHNTLGYNKKNFILDGDLQFPIAIGGPRFGPNTIQIIPRFKVRIFQDDPKVPFGTNGDISLPVRTPSTMPGFGYYRTFTKWWNPDASFNSELKKKLKSENRDISDLRDNKYIGIYAFHHSNGQDGDEIYPNDSVNIYNGNYGEQVVFELVYGHQRKFVLNGEISDFNNQSKKEVIKNNTKGKEIFVKTSAGVILNWRVSYENHPFKLSNEVFRDLSNIGSFPARSRMIGRHRLNGKVTLQWIPNLIEFINTGGKWCLITPESSYERWRLIADVSYILDNNYYRGPNVNELEKINALDISKRLNMSIGGYHVLKRSKYAAVFLEGSYSGSDRYNIYFNDSLWQLRFGLAFGFFGQHEESDNSL